MQKIIAGIDIGSNNFHGVVAKVYSDRKIEIIGAHKSPTEGIKEGIIIDTQDFKNSLSSFKNDLDNIVGYKGYDIIFGINGSFFTCKKTKGFVVLTDNEVGKDDIQRVIEHASSSNISESNRINVDTVPIDYAVDNEKNIKNPLGLKGSKLEANVLLIEGFLPYFKSYEEIFNELGIVPEAILYSPIGSSYSCCDKKQKELGTVIIDIGGSQTTVIVIEDGAVVSIKNIPMGGNHITTDIVHGFKINYDDAEELKIQYGTLFKAKKTDKIDLASINPQLRGFIKREELIEIIELRTKEIFEIVKQELKKLHLDRILAGGAVLIGGGAKLKGISNIAKEVLELPVEVGYPINVIGIIEEVNDPLFVNSVGIISYYLTKDFEFTKFDIFSIFSKIKKTFRRVIRDLIP